MTTCEDRWALTPDGMVDRIIKRLAYLEAETNLLIDESERGNYERSREKVVDCRFDRG